MPIVHGHRYRPSRHYSLSAAARELEIDRRTLLRWLASDLGIIVPRVRRGSKVVIFEQDLERLLAKRRDA